MTRKEIERKPGWHKYRINKLKNQLVRDEKGNTTHCAWNEWMMEEIEESKKYI